MPAQTTDLPPVPFAGPGDGLRHEVFCLPRPGEIEVRIEQYLYYTDGPNGRSVPTHNVTRCLECGAATRKRLEITHA